MTRRERGAIALLGTGLGGQSLPGTAWAHHAGLGVGEPCPDGRQGRLRLLVNGTVNAAMERYVPRDGDRIRVEFGPD
ncbi:MAG: hypothetical protein ACREKK_14510 [Candidatus Methylomirabilales bacterium]